MQAIILTGSTGFLGSRILHSLLMNTNYKLILVHKNSANIDKMVVKERIDYVCETSLEPYFSDYSGEVLGAIHAATEYGRSGNEIEKVLKCNLTLPINILNILKLRSCRFFINAESFFNKSNNLYTYLLDYSSTKKSLQYWLRSVANDLVVINLYLEHIYGEKDSDKKFIPSLIRDLNTKNSNGIKLSKGMQVRDFLYVDDAAESFLNALKYALESPNGLYEFEIGTGIGTTIFELCNKIKLGLKSDRELNFGALDYREDEIMKSIANVEMNHILNWKAQISLDVGVSKILGSL
jgi:nucleoside-diphosphate-sugar epimerase